MNISANPVNTPARRWLARAVVLVTIASLQLVWLGVFVCAARCARGGCAPSMAGSPGVESLAGAAGETDALAGHCGHPGTAPAAPGKRSGDAPQSQHSRRCPASNFRYQSAAARSVGAPQMRPLAPALLAVAFSDAAAAAAVPPENLARRKNNSAPVSVPAALSVPLRI